MSTGGREVAASRDARHRFSKTNELSIRLLDGFGVEGTRIPG